ncbi:MAG: LysR family transcriptional regulator [Haliea sp.]
MDNRALKYYEAVARIGSIRGASEVLCVAPSAISKKISALEERLGVKLLERIGVKGVRVTEAGDKLLEHIESIRIEEEKFLADVGISNDSESTVLRIATGGGFTSDLVTNGIKRFSGDHPATKYFVNVCSGSDVARKVSAGEVDIGLTVGAPEDVSVRPTLDVKKLFDCKFEPLSLVVPISHKLASSSEGISLEEVAALPFGLLTNNFVIRRILRSFEIQYGLRLNPILQSDSFEVLRFFLLADMGVSFLPAYCVRKDIARGLLAAVAVNEMQGSYMSVHVIVNRESGELEILSKFVKCLSKEMSVFHDSAPDKRMRLIS